MDSSLRVGVDIGGTFTDLVFMDAQGLRAWTKVSSTTDDFAQGIVQGLDTLISSTNAACEDIREVIHATTIATNAILEAKGAPTGLITTAGFPRRAGDPAVAHAAPLRLALGAAEAVGAARVATGSRRAHGHSGKHCA